MSVYHPSFNFLNKNSYDDFNLIVSHFDGDQGESDTWLGMDPIYSDSADGTRRIDYGAKFNSVATPRITVIKSDGTDFTTKEVRQFLKWTTGSRKNSYLELCEWSEIKSKWEAKFRLLGRVTKAYQQKLDARTIGLIIEFTTVSPFAYSPVQTIEADIYGDEEVAIKLPHESDDLDTPIAINVTFTNGSKDNILILSSDAMTRATEISGLLENETLTLSSNGFITSDSGRILGDDNFNYIFQKMGYSSDMKKVDVLNVLGNGHIVFQYIYFIKIGDCTIDVDVSADGMSCNGSTPGGNGGNTVVIEELPWDKITGRPMTISGFGIIDAYTKKQVDEKISSVISISEEDLAAMLEEILI